MGWALTAHRGPPFPEPGLVKGAVRLPRPPRKLGWGQAVGLLGNLLPVTLVAVPLGRAQSLSEWQPLPSCAQEDTL